MRLIIEHFLTNKNIVKKLKEMNIDFTKYYFEEDGKEFNILEIDKDIVSKKEMLELINYIETIDKYDYLSFIQERFEDTNYIHFETIELKG